MKQLLALRGYEHSGIGHRNSGKFKIMPKIQVRLKGISFVLLADR